MTINLTYSIADQSFRRGKSLGIFNVSLNLLRHLSLRSEIGSVTVFGNSTIDLKGLPPRVTVENHDEVLKTPLHRMAWDQFRVYSAAARTGNPWLLLAKGFASFTRRCPVKLAAVVYDALHDYCEDHYSGSIPWRERMYFKRSLQATLRNAAVIFTISDFTTSEVRRLAAKYRISCPPTYTIGIGFSEDDLLASRFDKPQAERDVLFIPTNPLPYKRTDLAVQYVARWQEETDYRGRVILTGGLPTGLSLPARSNWTHHRRLSYSELGQVMSQAKAVVFFSEYEGYGLPPAEGLLAGACPVYSDLAVTREVMRGAGFPFSNESYATFAEAMTHAFNVKQEQIESWRLRFQREHTWQKVCDRVVAGFQSVESG